MVQSQHHAQVIPSRYYAKKLVLIRLLKKTLYAQFMQRTADRSIAQLSNRGPWSNSASRNSAEENNYMEMGNLALVIFSILLREVNKHSPH